MLQMSEIREMSQVQLKGKIQELRKELLELNLKRSMAPLEKPHLLKNIKKGIAKLSTVLKEKG